MSSYSELIMNDFLAAKRNFNRLVRIGLIVTLFCHFYVVEPYFLYRAEEKAASEGLREGQTRIRELSAQLAQLKKTLDDVHLALEDIKERIRSFPDHLRGMLPVLERQLSSQRLPERYERIYRQSASPAQQYRMNAPPEQPGIPADMPPQIKTFEEAVRWYTSRWFDGLIKELDEKVIRPVLDIGTGSPDGTAEKLSGLSAEAVGKVRRYIETVDPDFWRSYGTGQVPVARGLYEVVSGAFDPLYREIETLSKEIRKDIKKRKERIEGMEKSLARSRELLKELESRLESLESPVGDIPVGLTDFIKLYPFLLSVLVAATAFQMFRSRNLYAALLEEKSRDGSGMDEKSLNYLGRCWYLPPFGNILYPLILLSVLSAFTGLFIRSVLLVIREPGLFESITSRAEPLSRSVFIAVYAIGALLITGAVASILKILVSRDNLRG